MNTTSTNESLVDPLDNTRPIAKLVSKVKDDIVQQTYLEKGWD